MSAEPHRERYRSWPSAPEGPARLARRIAEQMRDLPAPGVIPVEVIRAARAAGEGVLPLEPPHAGSEWRPVPAPAPGGPTRIRFTPAPAPGPRGVYLHMHGGGWTFGAPENADLRCRGVADGAGLDAFSVSYRFGPENRWPACAEDCLAAARCALDHADALGGAPVFVGGESAGAHLAAVLLLRLRAEGRLEQVKGAALTYGMFDLRMTPSMAAWGDDALVLSTPIVAWFCENLLGPDWRAAAADPGVSPLLADLAGMPPALLQIGDADPLLDDSLFMAERWRAAGAEAELAVWPGGVHAFDQFCDDPDGGPAARASRALTAEFLRGLL